MSATKSERLQREHDAFEAGLADLLVTHSGEFVVFMNEEPAGFFPTFNEAYSFALERFGPTSAFLVSEVKTKKPVAVSLSWDLGVMYSDS